MPPDERDLSERLAVLEERQKEMASDIRDILVSIQGPPRSESLRGRVHILESDTAAAKAAQAALDAMREISQHRSDRRFSRTEKITLLLFAAVTLTCTVMTAILAALTYAHHT